MVSISGLKTNIEYVWSSMYTGKYEITFLIRQVDWVSVSTSGTSDIYVILSCNVLNITQKKITNL